MASSPPEQAPDLPFEAASVLRLIRGFLWTGAAQPGKLNAESAGVLLWDLSADADAAAGGLPARQSATRCRAQLLHGQCRQEEQSVR